VQKYGFAISPSAFAVSTPCKCVGQGGPVSLACSVVYSAGLYLPVQGRLHWSQNATTHSIITHNSAGLIYCVAVA